MASIDNFPVTVFSPEGGVILPARPRAATLPQKSGVDGNAAILGGTRADPQGLRTVVEVAGSSVVSAVNLASAYYDLIFEAVPIVDQFGTRWDNVLIMDVIVRYAAKAGYATTWRVEAFWKILVATDV